MRKVKKVQNTSGLGIHIDHEKGTSQQWHTSTKRWGNKGWSLDYRRFAVANQRKN